MWLLESVLIALILTASVTSYNENTFTFKQRAHKPKTLRSDRVAKLMDLTTTSSEKYFEDVLLRPIMRERVPGTVGNLAVQEHIETTMTSLGWSVELDEFTEATPHGDIAFTNIIATHNPAAPRRLTLACHFDSKYFADFVFIGATDSAVPCAMMLDLGVTMNATLWKNNPQKGKDVSLQFIFFDGEEAFVRWTSTDSIYGARHLASRYAEQTHKVDRELTLPILKTMDVLVLLDLIGHKEVRFMNWFSETSKLFERLQKIEKKLAAAKSLMPVKDFMNPNTNKYFSSSVARGGIEDDHIPFLRAGVPILHLISYPFPKQWHKHSDNASALDMDSIHNIIKILRVFVAEYLHLSP